MTNSATTTGQLDHQSEFARAWADPRYPRFEFAPLDVNKVLAERYIVSEPLTFTRTLLWDMEVRKAWRPDLYIPYVVREGSASAWGGGPGDDVFVRASQQRLWVRPAEYTLVLEQTHLDRARQLVTFIGAAELPGPDGTLLRAGTEQPLFHVEHGVAGDELHPLNTWRILHLTEQPSDQLAARFAEIGGDPWLPGYLETYIRRNLGLELTRIE